MNILLVLLEVVQVEILLVGIIRTMGEGQLSDYQDGCMQWHKNMGVELK